MPISMLGIGSVLLVQDRRGSYALGGAVSACYALGLAALGPRLSRWVDRSGQARVLPRALAVHVSGLVALLALVGSTAPGWLLLPVAAVAGCARPPVGACVRSRWAQAVPAHRLPAAFALESVVDEVVFVLGPLLVVALAGIDPAAGILAAIGLGATGTLALAAQRSTQPPPEAHTAAGPVLRLRGLPVLVLSLAATGTVFGSLEVAMVAFAGEQGAQRAGGLLLALVALGSALAGLAYGARSWRTALPHRFLLGLVGLAVGVLPLLLAPGIRAMAPLALLAGVAISPTLIASFGLVESLVPPASRTEGFTWLTSGLGVGVATGAALAGLAADGPGARTAFGVCLAGALVALAVTGLGRRSLVAPAVARPVLPVRAP